MHGDVVPVTVAVQKDSSRPEAVCALTVDSKFVVAGGAAGSVAVWFYSLRLGDSKVR
jgi:hypothetical protein